MDDYAELRQDLQALRDYVYEEFAAVNALFQQVVARNDAMAADFVEMSETMQEMSEELGEVSHQLKETAQKLEETAQKLDVTADKLDKTSFRVSELSVRLAFTATQVNENSAAIRLLTANSEERWRQLSGRQRLNEDRVTRVLQAAEQVDVGTRCDNLEARLSEVEKILKIDPSAA